MIRALNIFILRLIRFIFLPWSLRKYRNLSAQRAESENYELRKLIHGKIDGIFLPRGSSTVVVQAARLLWKINDNGYVVDVFDYPGYMYSSGICLKGDHYIDWVFTGDKSWKKCSEVIDANDMSEQELAGHLDSAEIVEFYRAKIYGKDMGVCFLKTGDRAVILDITKHSERIDSRHDQHTYGPRIYSDVLNWHDSILEGYEKKNRPWLPFLRSHHIGDWKDASQPVLFQRFSREFYCFEEGFWGWLISNILGRTILSGLPGALPTSYWFGMGYFQLTHNSERLNFKAFVSSEDEPIDFNNIAVYTPQDNDIGDLTFIDLGYRPHHDEFKRERRLNQYYEHDVGLYAVRRKLVIPPEATESARDNVITLGQRTTYRTRNRWLPAYMGKQSHDPVAGEIHFYNDAEQPGHYLLTEAHVAAGFHAIPRTLSIRWTGPYYGAFKLYLNEKQHAWYNFHAGNSRALLELHFDEAEIVDAFQRLDRRQQPIELVVNVRAVDEYSASLQIQLRNRSDAIQLRHTRFVFSEPSFGADEKELAMKFDKRKLIFEYGKALNDKVFLQDYLELSQNIVANSPYPKEYVSLLTFHSAEMIKISTKDGGDIYSERLFFHYVNKILPYVGKEGQSEDVALNVTSITSNSLGFGIAARNDDVCAAVFEKLLGPGFDISTIKNGTLVFNLACYYAVHNQKPRLLTAIQAALRLGKKVEQFMTDQDFKEYRDDADFLTLLAAEQKVSADG